MTNLLVQRVRRDRLKRSSFSVHTLPVTRVVSASAGIRARLSSALGSHGYSAKQAKRAKAMPSFSMEAISRKTDPDTVGAWVQV